MKPIELRAVSECATCHRSITAGSKVYRVGGMVYCLDYKCWPDREKNRTNPPLAGYSGKKTGRLEIARLMRIEAAAKRARGILANPATTKNRDDAVAVLREALES